MHDKSNALVAVTHRDRSLVPPAANPPFHDHGRRLAARTTRTRAPGDSFDSRNSARVCRRVIRLQGPGFVSAFGRFLVEAAESICARSLLSL